MSHSTVIIGSGPAGLAAALALSRQGIRPLIVERLDRPALKLLASGGGRCNFSNALDMEGFMQKFGRSGAFMRNALRFAPRERLLDFLHSEHVEAVLTDGFYYFPASGKARDIADAFLRASGAEVRTESEAVSIEIHGGRVTGVMLKDGNFLAAEAVILAAGGCAWSGLGSSAGLNLARAAGHTVCKPLPAVAPLLIREGWVGSLAGVTLPQARLTLKSGRDTLITEGSLLFTHNGLSGFPALDLAGEVSVLCDRNGTAELALSVRSDRTERDWSGWLEQVRQESGAVSIRNLLNRWIPRSVAEILTEQSGCSETKAAKLTAGSQKQLIQRLTTSRLTAAGAGPMEKAMAMRGGVALKEVDPATMGSRIVNGLYFAGEILDLTGPCGGYNMQWAFSSGFLAGSSAAAALRSCKGKEQSTYD